MRVLLIEEAVAMSFCSQAKQLVEKVCVRDQAVLLLSMESPLKPSHSRLCALAAWVLAFCRSRGLSTRMSKRLKILHLM